MNLAEFRTSLAKASAARTIRPASRALVGREGDWTQAHALVDELGNLRRHGRPRLPSPQGGQSRTPNCTGTRTPAAASNAPRQTRSGEAFAGRRATGFPWRPDAKTSFAGTSYKPLRPWSRPHDAERFAVSDLVVDRPASAIFKFSRKVGINSALVAISGRRAVARSRSGAIQFVHFGCAKQTKPLKG